jgi:uncharacterized protein DUF6338
VVGTLEAVAVFLYAVVPGYVAVRAYEFRRPPLKHRTTLMEPARVVSWSALLWALIWWLGARGVLVDLLDEAPDGTTAGIAQDLYWMTAGVLGAAAIGGVLARLVRDRLETRGALESADDAWDRLLIQLRRAERAVLLKVRLRSGGEVYGAFAEQGRADWVSDGSGLLMDLEVAPDASGVLVDVAGSRGVFVPGEEIAALSVVDVTEGASAERAPTRD